MNPTQTMFSQVVHFNTAVQVKTFRLHFDKIEEPAFTWNFHFENRVKSLEITFVGNFGIPGSDARVQTKISKIDTSAKRM